MKTKVIGTFECRLYLGSIYEDTKAPFYEKKLIQDIESLKGNYTLIIVTHRLSTIKNCEKIILLSNGELVDHGNFDELVLRHDALKTDLITKKQQTHIKQLSI